MLGKETFLISRKAKSQNAIQVSWFYPSTYNVGMAGLGYQLVWSLFESDQDVMIRRGFTDQEENGTEESELFGFTVSWELDFINILAILKKHQVPLLSSDRSDGDPIVFGGGPVLTANPEPFADFFDVVLLGDAEAVIPAFLAAWKEARKLPERKERLLKLAQIPGLYVPGFYEYVLSSAGGQIEGVRPTLPQVPERPVRQVFQPPSDYVAHTVILSPDTAWADMFLVEVVRSCPQECRFCLASFLTRPFRPTKHDALLSAIDLGLEHTAKIGLLGPSVTEHPGFPEIARALTERTDIQLSIASIRADTLTDETAQTLRALGQRSVTIAIESGSERLRAIMKKNLTEQEIENAVDILDRARFESVKFYGIAGLPHETMEDVDETVRLMSSLKKKHPRLKFVLGISSFVPKAQTPFQWSGRDRECGKKLEYVRKKLAPRGIDVRPESHNWSNIQALLSRGDRRLTPVLLMVADSKGKLGDWKKALKACKDNCPDPDFYIFRDIPPDETLPWSHLVDQAKTTYLQSHLATAQSLAVSLPGGGTGTVEKLLN